MRPVLRMARKGLVAVVGISVLIFGVALIVLPGPAVVVVPLGLAILATEFAWARTLLQWIRQRLRRLQGRAQQALRRRRAAAPPTIVSDPLGLSDGAHLRLDFTLPGRERSEPRCSTRRGC